MIKILSSLLVAGTLVFSPPMEKVNYSHLPSVEEPAKDIWDVPNQCESFEYKKGKFKRIKKNWTEEDEQRFKEIIGVIAREMGADPRIFYVWGRREGDFRPSTMMVKRGDHRANKNAWKSHSWSQEKENELVSIMENSPQYGAGSEAYYQARDHLRKILKYKGNPWWNSKTEYKRNNLTREINQWFFGYGSFGMNSVLYVHVWDKDAPPWILCYDEGIISIITVVWAARKQYEKCRSLGFPKTYGVLDRRFSRGHCSTEYKKGFINRAWKNGLNPHAKPKLGDKWPEETTDRRVIYNYMRTKLIEEGLIEKGE